MRVAVQRLSFAFSGALFFSIWGFLLLPPIAIAVDSQEAAAADDRNAMPSISRIADREQRLAAKGMTAGSPLMIRIFKAESELELWIQKDDRFELFATYPICNWSGKLGPKLHEGDKQAPEGFYAVGPSQIHRRGRWPRSLNIGFPNTLDRALSRTGSLILVHGGCTSTGCYAMTNPVMEEIYGLAEQALAQGQDRIQVHVFPFRMTEANLENNAEHKWYPFWLTLKAGYDLFERTRTPPRISICNKKYVAARTGQEAGNDCPEMMEELAMAEVGPAAAVHRIKKRRRVAASRARSYKAAGRNTRKAYAAARKARMAVYAKRMRTSQVSGARGAN
jgi:murein L,D-transpeptidase YafK